MQVAQTRTAPTTTTTTPIARIGVVVAFAVLASATGLAAAGLDMNGLPSPTAAGYAGLFLAGVVASVTLILPVPMLGMVFVAASFLNPVGAALAAAAGLSVGLWPTYIAGTAGSSTVENIERSKNAVVRGVTTVLLRWFRTRPVWATFALSAVPNPICDWAGVMAGAAGVPFRKVLVGTFAGKSVQMTVVALIGYALAGHMPFPG
ncbi:MAG: hypothetical protein O3C10_01720 [Chloroflexi bacterium]|nr:hypothetical protein [Chloroflexota bacterium]